MKSEKKKDSIDEAVEAVNENEHQDLSKENLGNEPEEQTEGQNNKYKLEGYEDKIPEDLTIKKGWTVDSKTSRGPQDID